MNKLIITKDASKIYIEQQINVSNLVFYKNTFSLNCKFILLENKNNINTFKVVAQGEAFGFHTNNFLLSEIELNGLPTFTTSDDLFTYFNANFGEVVAGVTFDGQLTQGGNPVSSTNRLPVDVGGAVINIQGDVNIPNEVEIKNEVGNPIPTFNEVVGTLADEPAKINDLESKSQLSILKGIFLKIEGFFNHLKDLKVSDYLFNTNVKIREVEVEEKYVPDGDFVTLKEGENIIGYSFNGLGAGAYVEKEIDGINRNLQTNYISDDFQGGILTTTLKPFRVKNSDGAVLIIKKYK